MLSFANRPPQSVEDVSFSESGVALLESAKRWREHMSFYAKAAFTELVDAVGEDENLPTALELADHLVGEVQERFGHNSVTFGFAETIQNQFITSDVRSIAA
ncbi:MAG TPA: hypothetical protein VHC21_02375 [Candidatus Saccharimonadales bacterium]|nr:hypothetical protein [Candidatus Saccharimonadales bacterium]